MKRNSIAKSVFGVILITLITKLFGFAKSVITAGYLGANADTDVFYLALGLVVGITYSIFTAITVSFIPVYHASRERGKAESDKFLGHVLITFSMISILFMSLVIIFAMPLAKMLLLLNPDYLYQ